MTMIRKLQQEIGYRFHDPEILLCALTHSSYINEHPELRKEDCNERLEFLGDAVLEMISSDFLYREYGNSMEGELSRMRVTLVCEMALADIARTIGLGECLRMGKGMEKSGGRDSDAVISDALEALIAALYLDGGLPEAWKFVTERVLSDNENRRLFYDAKTILQEMVQEKGRSVHYRDLPGTGPEHDRVFRSVVLIGEEVLAEGTGHSKKKAEQNAAFAAISAIRKQENVSEKH